MVPNFGYMECMLSYDNEPAPHFSFSICINLCFKNQHNLLDCRTKYKCFVSIGNLAMKIGILGVGNLGCYIGGLLHATGQQVWFLARPMRRQALLQQGLLLTHYKGSRIQIPPNQLHLAATMDDLLNCDVILITVKSSATETVAQDLAERKSGAIIISLQNGIHNAEILKKYLPDNHVLAGMVPFNIAELAPCHFHQGTEGTILLEQPPSTLTAIDLLLLSAHKAMLPMQCHQDMSAVLWSKLLLNLNNAINALSGLPLKAELSQRNYRRVLAAAQQELLSLLVINKQALVKLTPLPPSLLPKLLIVPDSVFKLAANRMLAIDPMARSSMQDDIRAGRKTEIDWLQGEVKALAHHLGKACPINSRLYDLVKELEQNPQKTCSAAALWAEIKPLI